MAQSNSTCNLVPSDPRCPIPWPELQLPCKRQYLLEHLESTCTSQSHEPTHSPLLWIPEGLSRNTMIPPNTPPRGTHSQRTPRRLARTQPTSPAGPPSHGHSRAPPRGTPSKRLNDPRPTYPRSSPLKTKQTNKRPIVILNDDMDPIVKVWRLHHTQTETKQTLETETEIRGPRPTPRR